MGDPILKAWQVDCDHDDRSCIVWARSYPAARREGAQQLERDWEDVTDVTRVPELDDGVDDLLGWQLENNWHFECHACYRIVTEESGYVRRADRLFCNEDCAGKYLCERIAQHRSEAELSARVLDAYPDGTIDRQWSNEYGEFAAIKLPNGEWVHYQKLTEKGVSRYA